MSLQRAFDLLRQARFIAPLACEAACAKVSEQFGLDLRRSLARCGFGRGHLLDVVVYLPGGVGSAREQQAAEELVQLLLGEELFERWVGRVSVTPAARGGPLAVLNNKSEASEAWPVAELRASVLAAIEGLRRGLDGAPLERHAQAEDWVLFELAPEEARDYAAQDDLLVTSTCLPELKKSFLRREPFFSGRFSNQGELFAYLKFESQACSGAERLAVRARLEAALGELLEPVQGSVFGAGLGLRYSYLDVCLRTANSMETAIVPALRASAALTRGWLLFYDTELEREWIGLHAESCEPFWG